MSAMRADKMLFYYANLFSYTLKSIKQTQNIFVSL